MDKKTAMTENDLRLIEEANNISRWYYRDVEPLIVKADTNEAKERLWWIMWELKDLRDESL